MRSCEVCIVSCMIVCSLRDGRSVVNWMRTGGEFSFTGDARSTNFKLVISNYAALYAFAHCQYSCHFHSVLYVKWLLPWLHLNNMIPNALKLPRLLSTLLVTVFTTFLIIFLLNIYYLWKILCHLKYKYVIYSTHLFFNLFSNDFKFLKY